VGGPVDAQVGYFDAPAIEPFIEFLSTLGIRSREAWHQGNEGGTKDRESEK